MFNRSPWSLIMIYLRALYLLLVGMTFRLTEIAFPETVRTISTESVDQVVLAARAWQSTSVIWTHLMLLI